MQAKPVSAAAAGNLLENAMGGAKSGKSGAAVAMIGTLFKALNTGPPAAAADGDGAAAPAISAEEKEAITKAGMGALDQALGSIEPEPELQTRTPAPNPNPNPNPNRNPSPQPQPLTPAPTPRPGPRLDDREPRGGLPGEGQG